MSQSEDEGTECLIQLEDILIEVRNKILWKDSDIIAELDCLLKKANDLEKQKILEKLNNEFKTYVFMITGNYHLPISKSEILQPQKDYQEIYNSAKSQQNYQQILDILQDSQSNDFLRENNFPQILQQHQNLLQNMGKNIFGLFDLLQQIKSNQSQYQLLRKLLEYIYCSKINKTQQIVLEQIIGSQLMTLVYQLQYYIDEIKNKNLNQFNNFIISVQNVQMEVNQGQQEVFENQQMLFLYSLFTQNLDDNKKRQNLDLLIGQTLGISCESVDFMKINQALSQLIDQKLMFQECFIGVIIYYCLQYSQVFGLQEKINLLKANNQLIKKTERKQKLYHRFLKDQCQINDEIFLYIINCCVYFNPQIEEYLDLESYKEYLNKKANNQLKKYFEYQTVQNLLKFTDEQFIDYWKQLINFDYSELQKFNIDDNPINKKFTIFLWMIDLDQQMLEIFKTLFLSDYDSLLQCVSKNMDNCLKYSQFTLVNLFSIVSDYHNFLQKHIDLLSRSLICSDSLKVSFMLLTYDDISKQENLSSACIQLISEYKSIHWMIVQQFFDPNFHSQFIQLIIDNFYQTKSANIYENSYKILRALSSHKIFRNNDQFACFLILIQHLDARVLKLLNHLKKVEIPKIATVKFTNSVFFALLTQVQTQEQELLFKNFHLSISHEFYNYGLFYQFKNKKVENEIIHRAILAQYFHRIQIIDELIKTCEAIYLRNLDFYEEWSRLNNYFGFFKLSPQYLSKKFRQIQWPASSSFTLEDFNIIMAEYSKEEKSQIISEWAQDVGNIKNFKKLIPFFLKIIKLGENEKQFLTLNNQKIQKNQNINMKFLFQILLNNSNSELKFSLIHQRYKQHSVPLIYQNPSLETINIEEDQFLLNHSLFYLFNDSFTIINFTLSSKNSRIGKTSLLNQIFFQTQIFDTSDTCDMNHNTADIYFDHHFNGSRKFSVADVHGILPFSILQKILPLFKLWIVQMNSERELQENYQRLIQLNEAIGSKPKVCFILRNSLEELQEQHSELIQQIKNQNISILFIKDLSDPKLNEQQRKNELDRAGNLINSIIQDCGNDQNNLITRFNFLSVIANFDEKLSFSVREDWSLLEKVVLGFQELQMQLINSNQTSDQNFYSNLKSSKTKTTIYPSFCMMLKRKNIFILFQCLKERIKIMNKEKLSDLQNELNSQNEMLLKLTNQLGESQQSNENKKKIEKEINSKEFQIQSIINKRKHCFVGIELLWREIILSSQNFDDQMQNIQELIQKGEPFEFLVGESFSISEEYMKKIIKRLKNENAKILVFGILGPERSGKSSLLNKMFGTNFETGEGRLNSGIYIQMLEIQNKQQFNNLFDYVIFLDAEGIFNSFDYSEYDKKCTLFFFGICDIILVNVDGLDHLRFLNLIGICLDVLSKTENKFKIDHQIIWCFSNNQSDHTLEIFKQQILRIADDLKEQLSPDYYTSIFALITGNIKIFNVQQRKEKQNLINAEKNPYQLKQFLDNQCYTLKTKAFRLQIYNSFMEKIQNARSQVSYNTFETFTKNLLEILKITNNKPQFLEFTELKQLKQNDQMEAKLQALYDFAISEINRSQSNNIQILYQNFRQSLYLEQFNCLHKREEEKFIKILNDRKEQITNQLLNFKKEKKIGETYFLKCNRQLNIKLDFFQYQILQQIHTTFQKYFNENFQQLSFFPYHPSFYNNQDARFEIFEKTSYEIIKQQFSDFFIKSKYNQSYFDFLRTQCNKNEPNLNESFILFQKFKNQLQPCLLTNMLQGQELMYLKNSSSTLESRLEKSSVNMFITEFYQIEVIWQIIEKKKILEYFEADVTDDFMDHAALFEYKYNESQNWLNQFLIILLYFNVKWNQNALENLKNTTTTKRSLFRSLLSSPVEVEVKKAFLDFKNTFEFENKEIINFQIRQYFEQEFNKFHRISNKVQLIRENCENLQDLYQKRKALLKDNIIVKEQINCAQKNNLPDKCFSYIGRTEKFEKPPENFLEMLHKEILEKQVWNHIFKSIYVILKESFAQNQTQAFYQVFMKEKDFNLLGSEFANQPAIDLNLHFNTEIINMFLVEIEVKIEQINFQISSLKVILSQLGEKSIYHYALFIIWRFICYYQWRFLETEKEQNKKVILHTFSLEEYKTQHQFHKQIIKNLIQKEFFFNFNQKYDCEINETFKNETKKQMRIEKLEAYYLIKQLDQFLLIDFRKNKIKVPEIKNYILNQKQYLQDYIKGQLNIIQQHIHETYKEKLKEQLTQELQNMLTNVNQLMSFSKYFSKKQIFELQQDEVNKQKLQQLVAGCLEGQFNKLQECIYSQLIDKFQDYFNIEKYHKINQISSKYFFNIMEIQQVQNLDSYLATLSENINEIIQSVQQSLESNLYKIQIQPTLNQTFFNLYGCPKQCPFCQRKCDQQNSLHQQHSCQNGHLLQAMLGKGDVSRDRRYQSENQYDLFLFSCQNIKEEIKKRKQKWRFASLHPQENQKNQLKMMKIWDNGIGQILCSELKTIQVNFQKMFGLFAQVILITNKQNYTSKNEIEALFTQSRYNPCSWVSVLISLNNDYEYGNFQVKNLQQMDSKLKNRWESIVKLSNFQFFFKEIIDNQNSFDKIIILLQNEKEIVFSEEEINQFCSLPQKTKEIIVFKSYTLAAKTTQNQILFDALGQHFKKVECQYLKDFRSLLELWSKVMLEETTNCC